MLSSNPTAPLRTAAMAFFAVSCAFALIVASKHIFIAPLWNL